jgi:class 3 adenylate cyclase
VPSSTELSGFVDTIFSTDWQVVESTSVPSSSDVVLKNGASKIDAAFLYADLASSSKLAKLCPWETTAKIIRSYLDCAVRQIRARGGHIRSFDGDRVMGVFMGARQHSEASLCAREIDYCVTNIINPKAKAKFQSVRDNGIRIEHCVGIDRGVVRAVRAGIRNNNDLIWIGRAAALSAKLSDVRTYPYEVYISNNVYKRLAEDAKLADGKDIWESAQFTFAGEQETVYRTKTTRTP